MSEATGSELDALAVLISQFHDETWLCSPHEKARWLLDHGVRAVAAGAGDRPPAPSDAGLNLSAVNLARCTSPDGFNHPLASWSVAEWTNAVAGEAGEACNLAKKLIRFRDGVAGNNKPEDKNQDDLRRRIAEELADVVIYCDLAMQSVGYDMATVVRDVFNRKSQEIGSPHVLGAVRPTPRAPSEAAKDAAWQSYRDNRTLDRQAGWRLRVVEAVRAAYAVDFGASPAAAPPQEES